MYKSGITPWKDHPIEPLFYEFFLKLEEENPGGKILDIGCGDGWASIFAAQKGFDAIGIDSSPTAIEQADRGANKARVEDRVHFQVGDALDLPFESNYFDALIDGGLFHHILPENRPVYMDNILRVLKKDSFAYFSVFSMKNPEGIGQRFTREKIEDIFDHHFQAISFAEDPYPTETPAHILHFILKRKQ